MSTTTEYDGHTHVRFVSPDGVQCIRCGKEMEPFPCTHSSPEACRQHVRRGRS